MILILWRGAEKKERKDHDERNKNRRRKIWKTNWRHLEEMNKLQRREEEREVTNGSKYIKKNEIYENILSTLFIFITRTVNILVFCYLYEN